MKHQDWWSISIATGVAVAMVGAGSWQQVAAVHHRQHNKSYLLGLQMFDYAINQAPDLDINQVFYAMQDRLAHQAKLPANYRSLKKPSFVHETSTQSMGNEPLSDDTVDFLQAYAHRQMVQTLDSGVMLQILRAGHGPKINKDHILHYHYTGSLPDGTVFASSQRLGSTAKGKIQHMLPGLQKAMLHLREGDEAEVVVPPLLGFADQRRGNIPPNSPLVFKITIERVENSPGV